MTDDETPGTPAPRQYPTRASLRGRAPASRSAAPVTRAIPAVRPVAPAPVPAPEPAADPSSTTPSGLPLRTPGSSGASTVGAGGPAASSSPAAPATGSLPVSSVPAGVYAEPGAFTRPDNSVPTPPTGSRIPAGGPGSAPRQHPGRRVPRAAAVIVALIGLALVVAGGLQGTVFKPPATTTATLGKAPSQPVVVAPPGMLSLAGPRVVVTANSPSSAPVFLGIGRASDVQAYLAKVSQVSLTGEDGAGALTSKTLGSEATLPDPGSVDVWVVSVRGKGTANLNWPDVGGQWVLVAATDGKAAAPAELTFTWSGAKPPASGAALIAIGAVFLICGMVVLIMLITRSRMESAGDGR